MPKYLVNLDLNQNQLIKPRIENLASARSTPVTGQMYYNTTNNTLNFYNPVVTFGAPAGGVLPSKNTFLDL